MVPLPQSFYEPSAEVVASGLLGHWLIRNTSEGFCGGPIVETEAYLATDPACHGFNGETARNRIMFGEPGLAYVYFIYGNHYCVNAVCRAKGVAEAVLIRAIEVSFGRKWLQANRPVLNPVQLTNGPGKLCSAMKIDRLLDGACLWDLKSPLFIAENPENELFRKKQGPVIAGPRIGIKKAADLSLRFYLQKNSFVSR
jgi:DNA-3-methyladenine glycosylase